MPNFKNIVNSNEDARSSKLSRLALFQESTTYYLNRGWTNMAFSFLGRMELTKPQALIYQRHSLRL